MIDLDLDLNLISIKANAPGLAATRKKVCVADLFSKSK